MAAQGITGFEPLRTAHRARLDNMVTGDGRPLPRRLKDEIRRQLARLDAVVADIKAVEAERDALVDAQPATDPAAIVPEPAAVLVKLKGIGPAFAAVLWFEALFRPFGNRRQVYAGLAPSPWQSGSLDQGIGKSGNSRLRKTRIELAWLWLRYQPASAISRWFAARVGTAGAPDRHRRRREKAAGRLVALRGRHSGGCRPESVSAQ